MSANGYDAADLLSVALLQPSPSGGLSAAEVQKASLSRLLDALGGGGSAVKATERLFEQLEASGRARRNRARVELTTEGRARAHRVLGLSRELGPTKWDRLYQRHLAAAALGIATDIDASALERLGKAEGLRRELVRQHLDLPLDPVPQQKAFVNALGWALLERGASPEVVARARAKKSFAPGAIIDALCFTAAGVGAYAENQGVGALARQITGVSSRDWKELYHAVVLRLFRPRAPVALGAPNGAAQHARAGASVSAAEPAGAPSAPAQGEPIDAFAERVRAAARRAPTGRVGEHLVFIAHVWRELSRGGDAIDIDSFKRRVAEAYRAHALHLVKADLPQTFDPEDLAQSSVVDRDVELVFVETRGGDS